jgi:2-O-methyltransferase
VATAEEKRAIEVILEGISYPCVVELGAHCGEDGPWIRAACRPEPSQYVMVEPDVRNAQAILDDTHGKLAIWSARRLILGAISDRDGMADFHFCRNERDRNRASGSLRRPTGHLEHFPWIEFPFVAQVPTYTLDTVFEREWLTKIDLLWVDIQGAEREMILGGETALRHTRYAFLEAEDVELYEGEALKPELIALLGARGWALQADFGYNILLRNFRFEERSPR